jgi:hypothetical protein
MKISADQRRAKSPPPPADDPRYRRTCTRYGEVRTWLEPFCANCGSPYFSIPHETKSERQPE